MLTIYPMRVASSKLENDSILNFFLKNGVSSFLKIVGRVEELLEVEIE